MDERHESFSAPRRPACCALGEGAVELSRRGFLELAGGAALLTGLSWSLLKAAEPDAAPVPQRQPLVVKPILSYDTPTRRNQTSWRSWGGIHTQEAATEEVARIQGELEKLRAAADFPVSFLPVSAVRGGGEVANLQDAAAADAILYYAAGSNAFDAIAKLAKPTIVFLRHRSGPVYLWYEIVSPVHLRRYSADQRVVQGLDDQDVVVDSPDELLWRLRSLGGLKNTLGTRIVAIGGAGGWGVGQKAVDLAVKKWKLDIQPVGYDELGKLIQAARGDQPAVALAKQRAAEYLKDPTLKLETNLTFVENAFLLEQVFRGLMTRANCRAITVNNCMGTIMPLAQTTACLTLSLLNDAGYLAFCESDFVVIPSGILLAGISGRPVFLNDPTYPHDGVITLAHCTAPRRLDGRNPEPARILTHFESDYGAAPKVEMHKGQKVTNVMPDFNAARWVGLGAEILDAPFLPICRSQIDVQFKADSLKVAERMPGFHWMTVYGDYLRETGYALKRIPITWENLV